MKFLKGFITGLTIPILGFILIKALFLLLVEIGLMAEATESISSRRLRTIGILAICANLVPLQWSKRRANTNWIRGLVLATMVLAGLWLFLFRDLISVP